MKASSGSEWRIVKIHMLVHYEYCIRRGGSPTKYSADLWEHSHRETVKNPYRRTNGKDFVAQIHSHHDLRRARDSILQVEVEQRRRKNVTAMSLVCDRRRS